MNGSKQNEEEGEHELEVSVEQDESVPRSLEERQLSGNADGSYNLGFIDWENEWENVNSYAKV